MGRKRHYHELRDYGLSVADIKAFEELGLSGHRRPGKAGIAQQNEHLLRRQREFRLAADAIAQAFSRLPEVEAIALFGSVALPLWKEVPRFSEYRRARVAVWHECKDVDIAVWLSRLDNLKALNRARGQALNALLQITGVGVAHHQAEVFILEPETNRYLGRLCTFGQCPNGKPECLVPGCGREAFLRQHEDFTLRPEALSDERSVRLFDRRDGVLRRAADIPVVGSD